MMPTQLPPHDIEAEEAVVASVMVDAEAWGKVCGILTQWDFFREKNGWIFQACADLTADGIGLNQVTVGHQLARQDRLEELGGLAYLSRMITDLPTPVGVEHYAQIVRKDALYRSAIIRAQNVISAAYRAKGNLTELLDDWQRAGEELRGEATGLLGVDRQLPISLKDFLEAGTGEARMDIVGPIAKAGITFIGGGPGQGKTLLGLEIAMTKASGISRCGFTAEPGPVLFVGADMGEDDTRNYLDMLMFEERELALANLQIQILPTLLLDEPEGVQTLRSLVQETHAELVILDHFSCFLSSDGFTNRELKPILDCLRQIRDENVALVILDQSRKASTARNAVQVPLIDELYGGRQKGALADRVVFIKKDAASNAFIVKGAKGRDAGFADFTLSFGAESGWERLDGMPQHLTEGEATIAAIITTAEEGRTISEIIVATGFSERTVRDVVARLMFYQQIIKGPVKRGREDIYMKPNSGIANYATRA